jgi:hypothetical protein
MTADGKRGNPKTGFPLFPPALEIAPRFPHFHRPDNGAILSEAINQAFDFCHPCRRAKLLPMSPAAPSGALRACSSPRNVETPGVAVGTAVARCPPHRPVLALLAHTLLECLAANRSRGQGCRAAHRPGIASCAAGYPVRRDTGNTREPPSSATPGFPHSMRAHAGLSRRYPWL